MYNFEKTWKYGKFEVVFFAFCCFFVYFPCSLLSFIIVELYKKLYLTSLFQNIVSSLQREHNKAS